MIIPPDDLREAMSHIYFSQVRFQLGEMEDAEEALNEILKVLHGDQIISCMLRDQSKYSDEIVTLDNNLASIHDIACSPPCISHVSFGSSFCDINICALCKTESEPILTRGFVYRCYADEMIDNYQKKSFLDFNADDKTSVFSMLIRKLSKLQLYSCSDDSCKGKATTERFCLKAPETFALGITWKEEVEKVEILRFLDLLSNVSRIKN